jgi:hypothetical protein
MTPAGHLIVHGWQGSGPAHWQRWVATRLPGATYLELPDPDRPQRDAWLAALRAGLEAVRSPVVLCHSLGAVLWLHHASTRDARGARAARVLLVAPPGPAAGIAELAGFLPAPIEPEALAASSEGEVRLVCSDWDPYCPEGAQRLYGAPLALPTDVIAGGGHLNADSGHGPWPAVEAWARGKRAFFV